MSTANDVLLPVPQRLLDSTRDVVRHASTPLARSSAAGDELAIDFDSDDRRAMVRVAALFLARVAYLDERAAADRASRNA